MKEVGFLEVVIGLERIKMEEEKVKDILDWLTLQEICYKTSVWTDFRVRIKR